VSEPVVVLDAGVIDQVVSNREFRVVLEELVRSGWTPIIPIPVLAEAITGRAMDAPANQAINRFGTTPTDEALARHAGALRYAASRTAGRRGPPSGIDAIVAAHAAESGSGVVFTTDPDDLRRLLVGHTRVRVERP
jgi:predicted nucleic acid-binding protein